MEYQNRMRKQLLLVVCVLAAVCMMVSSVSAAITAEATGACTNPANEGIEYFVPYSALAEKSNDWRTNLTTEVTVLSDGSSAGTIKSMEVMIINGSNRYQCTEVLTDEFSCNSIPQNALISGIYLRYIPSGVTEDTKLNFKVYQTNNTSNVLLNANGVLKFPPYPCARNIQTKDFIGMDGKMLILNTSSDTTNCKEYREAPFVEKDPAFALVNWYLYDGSSEYDKIDKKDRFRMTVSPNVTYKYTLELNFITVSGAPVKVTYKYDPTTSPVTAGITDVTKDGGALASNPITKDELPLKLSGGKLHQVDTDKVTLGGEKDFPSSTDFDIKFWYENTAGTLGYENSLFHFERNLNVQFAPVCPSSGTITGISTKLFDRCDSATQGFAADLTYYTEVDGKTVLKGVEITKDEKGNAVTTSEPKDTKNYYIAVRKCADSACDTVKTTSAEVYSITYVDGSGLTKTAKQNGHAIHSPGSARGVNVKLYKSSDREFTITGVRLTAKEPGTYVVYAFLTKENAQKAVPTGYAAKFYVVVSEKDQLDACSTLANNGYFRAYWDDCQDSDKTQLLKFEHIPGTEEAWIRNTSAHGVHFPYVHEWSYVPQQMEVASLTCKAEALSAGGQPGNAYCRPNDVYVPPYTKVTITGGTLYLNSIPTSDEYRVAYARTETYNISHLFFSLYVKECENVKKIPDTGISLRSPLKVNAKVNEQPEEATSYVFTGNSLRIPAIGLGMETPIPIVHVYYKEGAENLEWDLGTLGNYVGELEGGSYLPYAGNSVLTGHYYSMGVFKNLEGLNMDDEIVIYGNDGIKYVYRVVQKFIAQPEDVYEMFQQVGERSLTLVTCENYNLVTDTYERRTLVRATIAYTEPYEENIW